MNIITNYLEVKKTARYSTFGNLTSQTKYFWFFLHGSNMQCEQVLYKFADFDPTTHFVVAPEGLSRTYQKGFGGDTVAIWMTKRDRLKEISDFSNYLSALYRQYSDQIPSDATKIVAGFSQGGTTMYRWLDNTKEELDFLIAYSTWVPEDIDLTKSKTPLQEITKIFTYGLQDEYLTEERVSLINANMEKNNLLHSMEEYDGTHRIDKGQLKVLFEKYIKVPGLPDA